MLLVDSRGPGDFLVFRCRVGHAFSLASLVPLKEEQLEGSLWSAVEVCEELVSLYECRAGRAEANEERAEDREAIRRIYRHADVLRRIIATGGRPSRKSGRR